MAEEFNPSADEQQSPPPPTCRVALIGSQRQRVAKVTAIIHAKNNDTVLGSCSVVDVSSLLTVPSSSTTTTTTTTTTTAGGDESLPLQLITDPLPVLPKGVPSTVKIEVLPCVATFDSYEDEHGATIRYLVSLEYHGPNGTLVKGKSLAPFFDEIDIDDIKNNNKNNTEEDSPFPGIAAVAIGAGIETTEDDDDDDVDKIRMFLDTLSSSCAAQQQQQTDNHDGKANEMLIECIQPNPEYTSMKEENEVFRQLSDEGKKEAVANGTIGPGKMAKFVYNVAKRAVRQKWEKELGAYEQSFVQETEQEEEELTETQSEQQQQPVAPIIHAPDSEKIRYACKRCRTILFGMDDLEDPPHVASQHDFRKRRPNKAVYGNTGTCQNHCIAQPLPWMDNGCGGMEGKLHCPKCTTKVGHYSWRGAQCSCGTWVTPTIMVPVSKVDEMKPMSQNVIAATGALYANHFPGMTMVQMPPVVGVNRGMGMINQQLGSMDIAGDYNLAGRPENTP